MVLVSFGECRVGEGGGVECVWIGVGWMNWYSVWVVSICGVV